MSRLKSFASGIVTVLVFLLQIVLYLIAYIAELPVIIMNLVTLLWVNRKIHRFLNTNGGTFQHSAQAKDRFWNDAYKVSLTHWFSNDPNSSQFGDPEEMISSVLGKKGVEKSLTKFGWVIWGILYAIDVRYWFSGGHCFQSITYKDNLNNIKE